MTHLHVQAGVPTTSIDQIDRVVVNLCPDGDNGLTNQNAPGLQSQQFMKTYNTDGLYFWYPSACGAANITVVTCDDKANAAASKLQAKVKEISVSPSTVVNHSATSWPYSFSSYHDPAVRDLYPEASVRPTHARLIMDVNMGGGHALLRAMPMTKEMQNWSCFDLKDAIMSDCHTVKKLPFSGQGFKRYTFKPWIQSRRCLGDWTTNTFPNYDTENQAMVSGTNPTSASKTYKMSYNDEFPYGGWVFCYESINTMYMGAIPVMKLTSSLTIQVQLNTQDNWLTHRGKFMPVTAWRAFHDRNHTMPQHPTSSSAATDAVEAARPKQNEHGGNGSGKKNQKFLEKRPQKGGGGSKGKNGPRTQPGLGKMVKDAVVEGTKHALKNGAKQALSVAANGAIEAAKQRGRYNAGLAALTAEQRRVGNGAISGGRRMQARGRGRR